ncbi:hypothetical protein F5Y09DRAFT_338191 [Xylaria sp. FL1042]|nr:hypothetical protein F5Y09DRAFT_338191 [Xylaria sp. FL1042]
MPSFGFQFPDCTSMPKGDWVGVPVLGIHGDEKYNANANVFEPFRFVKYLSTMKTARVTSYEINSMLQSLVLCILPQDTAKIPILAASLRL